MPRLALSWGTSRARMKKPLPVIRKATRYLSRKQRGKFTKDGEEGKRLTQGEVPETQPQILKEGAVKCWPRRLWLGPWGKSREQIGRASCRERV